LPKLSSTWTHFDRESGCAGEEFLQRKYVYIEDGNNMNNDHALHSFRTAYQHESEDMTPLLKDALDAHGGLTQWKRFTKISATIRSGGDFWEMKGVPQDPSPRQMSASLDREWSSVSPYGGPDKLTDFTPSRVAIVTVDGRPWVSAPNDSRKPISSEPWLAHRHFNPEEQIRAFATGCQGHRSNFQSR
jgi:hypothetical protein